MTDYISREAVLQDLCGHCHCQHYCDETGDRCTQYGGITILPAADVVEVRHARWKQVGLIIPMYECGQCHSITLGGNFCSNCGAKMDMDEEAQG